MFSGFSMLVRGAEHTRRYADVDRGLTPHQKIDRSLSVDEESPPTPRHRHPRRPQNPSTSASIHQSTPRVPAHHGCRSSWWPACTRAAAICTFDGSRDGSRDGCHRSIGLRNRRHLPPALRMRQRDLRQGLRRKCVRRHRQTNEYRVVTGRIREVPAPARLTPGSSAMRHSDHGATRKGRPPSFATGP